MGEECRERVAQAGVGCPLLPGLRPSLVHHSPRQAVAFRGAVTVHHNHLAHIYLDKRCDTGNLFINLACLGGRRKKTFPEKC